MAAMIAHQNFQLLKRFFIIHYFQGLLNQFLLFRGPAAQDSPLAGPHDRSAETLTVGRARDAAHHGGLAADERPNSMRTRRHRRRPSFGICRHLICDDAVGHDVLTYAGIFKFR